MAATILHKAITGVAPGTATDVDDLTMLFNTSDSVILSGTTNPLKIPTTGSKYSFWKHYRPDCTVTPATLANNFRFYTDGANSSPAGVLWWGQRANVGADAGYRQATGTVGDTGTQLTAGNHTGLVGAPVDIFTWTSASPLALTGDVTNPATGLFGDLVAMQIEVQAAAQPGALAAEPFDLVWDET